MDKDPGAIEVAKTNIWKEAVKLSPADYNYRELKTDVVKILPNLELNFHCADSLVDVELEKAGRVAGGISPGRTEKTLRTPRPLYRQPDAARAAG